jgi:hypothetical protein
MEGWPGLFQTGNSVWLLNRIGLEELRVLPMSTGVAPEQTYKSNLLNDGLNRPPRLRSGSESTEDQPFRRSQNGEVIEKMIS